MKVVSYTARLEAETNAGSVFMDATRFCSGYAAGLVFYPNWHHVVLVRMKADPSRMAIVAMEAAKWEDSIESEWEIVQRLSPDKPQV